VIAVSSGISVGKDKGLVALSGSPSVLEKRSVPVYFQEKVRHVNPSLGAVGLSITSVAWENRVLFVVGQAGGRVIARREVNISSQGRGVAITVLIGKANSLSLVVRVANSSHGTV
jgi:hypothetical protein